MREIIRLSRSIVGKSEIEAVSRVLESCYPCMRGGVWHWVHVGIWGGFVRGIVA
jgi:hypothetical protein